MAWSLPSKSPAPRTSNQKLRSRNKALKLQLCSSGFMPVFGACDSGFAGAFGVSNSSKPAKCRASGFVRINTKAVAKIIRQVAQPTIINELRQSCMPSSQTTIGVMTKPPAERGDRNHAQSTPAPFLEPSRGHRI